MHISDTIAGLARRAVALGFLVAGTASLLPAQQVSSVASGDASSELMAAADSSTARPFASDNVYSSSAAPADDAVASERFDLSSAAFDSKQPPPRRRYGRPNYADSHTNPDGSNKYTFVGGVGFNLPTGGTHNYLTPGYRFQVGGGRNFNKTLALLVQFDYDHFGFQTATLNKLLTTYNAAPTNAGFTQLGGTSHDWSFTLNPVVNFLNGDRGGAYLTGGVGFYHKTANFTVPGTGEYCDPYYGCYQYTANETVDKYTSNAFGANGGLGFTYKPSRFASERLFAEIRYVWTDNQPKPFNVSGTTAYYNAFPQNSARTTYVPITFGLRF
jgi:hypothetical protein